MGAAHDMKGMVEGFGAAAAFAVLDGLRRNAAAEDARRAAGWQRYHGERSAGREQALWQAVDQLRAALAAKDSTIAALRDEIGELVEENADLSEEVAVLAERLEDAGVAA